MILAVLAGLLLVVLGSDLLLGRHLASRASCVVGPDTGISVDTDTAALPLTAGLATGSIGRATASVPWPAVSQRLSAGADGVPGTDDDRDVTAGAGPDGDVVAAVSDGVRAAEVSFRPVVGSGGLVLEPQSLTVGGRRVPVVLARAVAGPDAGLLDARAVDLGGWAPGGDEPTVLAADVGEDGLTVTVEIPARALVAADGGCPAGDR